MIGEYVYDDEGGRHQAFYSPVQDAVIFGDTIKAHERVQVEQSLKYSQPAATKLWNTAGLAQIDKWALGEEYGESIPGSLLCYHTTNPISLSCSLHLTRSQMMSPRLLQGRRKEEEETHIPLVCPPFFALPFHSVCIARETFTRSVRRDRAWHCQLPRLASLLIRAPNAARLLLIYYTVEVQVTYSEVTCSHKDPPPRCRCSCRYTRHYHI